MAVNSRAAGPQFRDIQPGMDQSSLGQLDPVATPPHDFDERPFRMSWALPFVPVLAIVALALSVSFWRPLDDSRYVLIGIGLSMLAIFRIRYVQKQQKAGVDIARYFPLTTWLLWSPMLVAAVLLINGALDRSPAEEHNQVVLQKYITHGRSTSYNIVFSSWRPGHASEKRSVSPDIYAQFRVNDRVVIEVHKGALGIPWAGKIHKPGYVDVTKSPNILD
jgi:hypothetical protein